MRRRTFLKSLAATVTAGVTGGFSAFAAVSKMKITRVRAYMPPNPNPSHQPERHGRHHRNRCRDYRETYHLALKQTDKLDKVTPRTYGHVLYLYTKHPEAKSLAPDGTSCTCETRGLLQRSSVVAASRRYVGKETDRRWEQGEDLSLVEFKAVEYQGSKQVVASDEIKQRILKTGIRKLERETKVSHHTVNRILRGEPVRRKTLAKIVKRFQIG